MTNETRQFILDTLLPYKENPINCAVEDNTCSYLDSQGRKCAVGKHLIEGAHQSFSGSVNELIEEYGENIFTEEAKNHNIPENVWYAMQQYHDHIALEIDYNYTKIVVERLEDITQFKFPEL